MNKNRTTESFIIDAKKMHGNKYTYDKSVYIGRHMKICITCPIHGDFWQEAGAHLSGSGCPKCRHNLKSNTEEFISKAKKIHGDKYDYSEVDYKNNATPVKIICPIHGGFWQIPSSHLSGKGCAKCSGRAKSNTEEFISKAKKIHGNKYDYSKTVYNKALEKVKIICPVHGEFWQTPAGHLRGLGCFKCGREESANKQRKKTSVFIEDAKKIHGDKYNYSKVEYNNKDSKVCIICPEHGEFWQSPNNHLRGNGCPQCIRTVFDTESFKEKANEIHQNKYNYKDVVYTDYEAKVKIICPIHGDFWQTPDAHLHNHGCPICGQLMSKAEDELNKFINEVCGIETKTRDRSLLTKKLECDIVIPSHKLAIEFDGIQWHSEKFGRGKDYHLNKTEIAKSKGYHLIHIFEDEWLEHKDIILNKIKHFLGKDTDRPVVGARKCLVETVSKAEAESFLTTYHIQGYVPSTAYYGAIYEGNLVGVMAFKQEKPGKWNLTRFTTDTNYRLPGLASKIFKQFLKDSNPLEVKTFLDRRWSHGDINMYDQIGFKLVETLSPDYRYVVKNQRIHKFNFRKQILHKKYGLPLTMTEREMTEKLGFYRIWDCGLYKYVWKQKEPLKQ